MQRNYEETLEEHKKIRFVQEQKAVLKGIFRNNTKVLARNPEILMIDTGVWIHIEKTQQSKLLSEVAKIIISNLNETSRFKK